MVDAADGFIAEKNVAMFERSKVFTAAECRSRYEITLETYAKHIHIDASIDAGGWQAAAFFPPAMNICPA